MSDPSRSATIRRRMTVLADINQHEPVAGQSTGWVCGGTFSKCRSEPGTSKTCRHSLRKKEFQVRFGCDRMTRLVGHREPASCLAPGEGERKSTNPSMIRSSL